MKIYAISDIHGCSKELERALSLIDFSVDNKLILLGDYIHGKDGYGVLDKIINLQKEYGTDRVIALLGNHEDMVLDGICSINNDNIFYDGDEKYIEWLKTLQRYYETEKQIFCHAGICEEAEDLWKWSTDDYMFTSKFPAQFGKFYKDIIAGHIGTAGISGDSNYHDIYFDGQSHYYIDGTTLESGNIPILMYDTGTEKYYSIKEDGAWYVFPYEKF